MIARLFLAAVACFLAAAPNTATPQLRSIQGTYRNPALGYSIKIPRGLRGQAGAQAGPERGMSIVLLSGGTITVFGEPNSLEWKTPEDGLTSHAPRPDCALSTPQVGPALLGKLHGMKATFACGDRIFKSILAFRPGGGLIYWVQLETTRAHESEDDAILARVASTFRLIHWD